MSFVRPLAIRAIALTGVLLVVLLLLVVSLGATGVSDKLLNAIVGEEIRGIRAAVLLQSPGIDPDVLEETVKARREDIEASYGLNRPWWKRLPDTVLRVLSLDLGEARFAKSTSGSRKVSDIVLERLPNTALLLTTSLVITAIIGLGVGVRMATKVGSKTDRVLSYFSAISFAMPAWWMGILMILIFHFQFGLLPAGGMYGTSEGGWSRFGDLVWHAILPVTTLVLVSIGPYLYSVRTMTMNVAQEDHVMIARAKGMPEGIVARRHILRVAAPPIVTGLILGLTGSLGGSILIETVFNWRGMGLLFFEALTGTPDEGVIVALTFVFTLMYVAARFLLEVLYVVLDPRVRYT